MEYNEEVKAASHPTFRSSVLEAPETAVTYEIELPGVSILVGPNGCGKSTICRSIHNITGCGFIPAFRDVSVTLLDARALECYHMRPGSWFYNNPAADTVLRRIRRIQLSSYNEIPEFGMEVVEEIESTIGGRMYYDDDSKTFFLQPSAKGKLRIPAENLPSGVRTLGPLQMLAASYRDGARRPPILIIDDLEGSLYPAWQIVFASLLFKFAAKGIRVLATANSVYTLEAIYAYAEMHGEYGKRPRVDFRCYLGAQHGKVSSFTDVSTEPNILYGPLSRLMRQFL